MQEVFTHRGSPHVQRAGAPLARNPRGSTQLLGHPNLALSKWTPQNHSRHQGTHSAIWLTHSIWAQENSISQIPLPCPHLPQPHIRTIWTVHKVEDNFRGFPRPGWMLSNHFFLACEIRCTISLYMSKNEISFYLQSEMEKMKIAHSYVTDSQKGLP